MSDSKGSRVAARIMPAVASAEADLRALLKVNKGSRFVPIVLFLVSAVAFMVHGLGSVGNRGELTARFGMACTSLREAAITAERAKAPDATDADKAAALAVAKQVTDRKLSPLAAECLDPTGRGLDQLVTDFRDTTNMVMSNPLAGLEASELGGYSGVGIVLAAAVKEHLDVLWSALKLYWKSAIASVLAAAGFALLPGIAGLVYRRDFWTWFGFGFVALLAIQTAASSLLSLLGAAVENADKSAPSVGGADLASDPAVLDLAANITAVLLVQLGVLVLAFRLRRHSTRPPMLASFVSPARFNAALFWVLLIVGLDSVVNLLGTKPLWNRLWAVLPFSDTIEWWNFVLFGLPFAYAVLKMADTWSGSRPKNIVVLLDGTSNTPDQLEMGFLAQTNVFKLFRMLKADKRGAFAPDGRFNATLCKIYGERQIGFYYTGIGNKYDNDPLLGTLSQATGLGASGIVERAYLDLIRVWRPGDRVFIFGFSRGAATARILSRMVDERGAPRSSWTLRLLGRHWTLLSSRRKNAVPIDVLGCWDTVGSFGIAKTIAGINFQQLALLHDMSVPDNVARAYHMVALDEERQEFEPTLMEPDPIRPDRIVEVWFSGTHAGVGGGFATDRLSDVPLDFLLAKISSGYGADATSVPGDETWGLYLSAVNGLAGKGGTGGSPATSHEAPAPSDAAASPDRAASPGVGALPAGDVFTIYPDPRGQLRVWMSKLYNYRPRKLPLHAVIHQSVFERMRTSEPVYAPQALFDLNDALDAKRDLICAKVAKLDETKSLDAAERTAILEYTDKMRLSRWTSADDAAVSPAPRVALVNPA